MNGDLISREAALDKLRAFGRRVQRDAIMDFETRLMSITILDCINIVKESPAVDALEVVRCKDCKYSELLKDSDLRKESPWIYYSKNCRICRCTLLIEDEPILVDDDFFCAYGANMDKEGEANEQGAHP